MAVSNVIKYNVYVLKGGNINRFFECVPLKKMSKPIHIKIIVTQLENLEYLKIQLESLLIHVNNVISRGQCWINDNGNKQPHYEINSFLAKETSECFHKCLRIAEDEHPARSLITEPNVNEDPTNASFLFTSLGREESVTDVYETTLSLATNARETTTPSSFADDSFKDSQDSEVTNSSNQAVDKLIFVKPKKIRYLENKLKDHEKKIKTLMKTKTTTEKRNEKQITEILQEIEKAKSLQMSVREISSRENSFEEHMKEMFQELKAARNLMSNLQSQLEVLFKLGNDHDDKFNDMLRKFNELDDAIEEMGKKFDSVTEESSQSTSNVRNFITVSGSQPGGTVSRRVQVSKQLDEMEKRIDYLETHIVTVKEEVSLEISQCKESTDLVINEKNGTIQAQIVDVKNQLADFSCMVECLQKDSLHLRQETASTRIAFSVGLSNCQKFHKGSVVRYDQIYSNVGECYDVQTGRFTTHISGLYIFHVDTLSDKREGASLSLYLNSEYKMSVGGGHGKSIILHLNTTDTCRGGNIFFKELPLTGTRLWCSGTRLWCSMRHSKHIKVIQSQVEILEDLNCDLERLVDFIKNLVKQGTSWMNESESKLSFVQINQLLTSETANCIQKCINIACEK
ncbi:hypothetical protein Btru_033837 [Bulinus truncatus]|nr:hypothetical protein Btru_033837 [Bulinus truncatus]